LVRLVREVGWPTGDGQSEGVVGWSEKLSSFHVVSVLLWWMELLLVRRAVECRTIEWSCSLVSVSEELKRHRSLGEKFWQVRVRTEQRRSSGRGWQEGQLDLFFKWGQVEGEKAFGIRNQSNRMEILDRKVKVMARFGQKLSLVRLGEAFDLAQLICQVLKSQKERK
jgi:hypothetical protein